MTAPASQISAPSWHGRCVVTFDGQFDTRIATGEDYPARTLASVFVMEPDDRPKASSPAMIPSSYVDYDAREHAAQRERGSFVALCGDIDGGDHAIEQVRELVEKLAGGCAWLIYASAHSRPGDRRWRIILPLADAVAFTAWQMRSSRSSRSWRHAACAWITRSRVPRSRSICPTSR